jgi:hypothetical protein
MVHRLLIFFNPMLDAMAIFSLVLREQLSKLSHVGTLDGIEGEELELAQKKVTSPSTSQMRKNFQSIPT